MNCSDSRSLSSLLPSQCCSLHAAAYMKEACWVVLGRSIHSCHTGPHWPFAGNLEGAKFPMGHCRVVVEVTAEAGRWAKCGSSHCCCPGCTCSTDEERASVSKAVRGAGTSQQHTSLTPIPESPLGLGQALPLERTGASLATGKPHLQDTAELSQLLTCLLPATNLILIALVHSKRLGAKLVPDAEVPH